MTFYQPPEDDVDPVLALWAMETQARQQASKDLRSTVSPPVTVLDARVRELLAERRRRRQP